MYIFFRKKLNTTPANYKAQFLKERIIQNIPTVDCKIIDLPETPVLFLSYIGNYNYYTSTFFEEDSWDKLYDYAFINNILSMNEEYWGICYDDTGITNVDKCSFYACISITKSIKSRLIDEVKSMILPADKYAVYTHKGSYNELTLYIKASS